MQSNKACAKIILFGEHAVVYGKPGIALPIKNLYTMATVVDEPFSYETDKELSEEETLRMAKLFRLIFEKLDIKENLSAHIESNIHRGTGLGSSASLSVALIKGFADYLEMCVPDEKVNEIAFECEKIFHGSPSGIDNAVITFHEPIYFKDGKVEFIRIKKPFRILIAESGEKRQATKEVVLDVKDAYEKNTSLYTSYFDSMGKIAEQAREALEKGETAKIGNLMNQNHEFLQKINVSSAKLDRLVAAARKAGALGAKLVGAGRGGNIVALIPENKKEKIKESLIDAGAAGIIETIIK